MVQWSSVYTSALETIQEQPFGCDGESNSGEVECSNDNQANPATSNLFSSLSNISTMRSTLRATEISIHSDVKGSKSAPIPVPLNFIAAPHQFENELVRGKLLFMVDSNDESVPEPLGVHKLFIGHRNLFWIQMQLQFKQLPSGIVYIGGEVPRPMNLGFFTSNMARAILSMVEMHIPGVHYSFGNKKDNDMQGDRRGSDESARGSYIDSSEDELPHICFPLYTAADQFVVTPSGLTPPPLGTENLGETKEQSRQRKHSGQFYYPFNTRDTYSFHFHSEFIDFGHWQVVNLPSLRNTDLRAFWDDMPLRIVCYSVSDSSRTQSDTVRRFRAATHKETHRPSLGGKLSAANDEAKKAVHSIAVKQYMCGLELNPQNPTTAQIYAPNTAEFRPPTVALSPPRDLDSGRDTQLLLKQFQNLRTELSLFEFHIPAWFEYINHLPAHCERRVGYVFAVRTFASDGATNTQIQKPSRKMTGEYIVLHTALESFKPLSFDHQKLQESDSTTSSSSLDKISSGSTSENFQNQKLFNGSPRSFFGSRSRSFENLMSMRARTIRNKKIDDKRVFLENQLQKIASNEPDPGFSVVSEKLCMAKFALLELLRSPSGLAAEWQFLNEYCTNSPLSTAARSGLDISFSVSSIPKSGRGCMSVQVLRVVGTSQWRNEWMTLNPAACTLQFYRTSSSTCKLSISVDQVLTISKDVPTFSSCWCRSHYLEVDGTDSEASRGTQLYWLHLGLAEKHHHIAFASRFDQTKWHGTLMNCMNLSLSKTVSRKSLLAVSPRPQTTLKSSIARSTSQLHLDAFGVDVCIVDSNLIKEKARVSRRLVLNDSCLIRMSGTCVCSESKLSQEVFDAEPDAGNIVRHCLRHVIRLHSIRLNESSSRELLIFQQSVCALRWVNRTSLLSDENERKAFFLNLYHLIMLHASVLGLLPSSKSKWNKFFNGVTYNVGGLYFSLAEIEFNILRAPMKTIREAGTVLVIPKLGEPDSDPRSKLCLKLPDFRLNFAINCMTRSCWEHVVVFDRLQIDDQLDRVTGETISHTLVYDRDNRSVQLPKVCDWYHSDFTKENADAVPRSLAANHEILGQLLHFVRGPERHQLKTVWQYLPYLVDKYTFEKYDYRFHDKLTEAPPPLQHPWISSD